MSTAHYLYVDTSDHLVVGLLNSKFEWVEFLDLEGAKNSGRIHAAIYEILQKHHLEPKDLNAVIQNSGPGSYTGMRVSEGISQILEWQGIPVCSFFHFEVPELLGISQGKWIAKAFKGEFFISTWDGAQRKTELLDLVSALDLAKKEKLYCHFRKSLEKDFSDLINDFQETGDLIFKQGSSLFSLVLQRNSRLSPYYFRTVDQEFKVSR